MIDFLLANAKWILFGLVHAALIVDFILDQKDMTTISEFLWNLPLPRWIPYFLALAMVEVIFFAWSPEVAGIGLVLFVLGHWSRFNR